jgi:hypothetical protein
MPLLKHSKIYRGGITAPQLTIETHHVSCNANAVERALDARFHLASKGGGTTSVLLRLGLDDLPAILDVIAEAFPEMVTALSSAATTANAKLVAQLAEARRVQGDDQARTSALVNQLESVSEFVTQKYHEARAGADDKEAAAMSTLSDVIIALRCSAS